MLAKLGPILLIGAILGCSGSSGGGGVADESGAEELALAGIEAGLYHLPNRSDATNLALYPNQSFRWSAQGCSTTEGDFGRWAVEEGRLVLYPRSGRSALRWPGVDDFSSQTRIELSVQSEASALLMEISEASGIVAQAWQPGGVCPVCDGSASSEQDPEACADPLHEQVSASGGAGAY